MVRTAFIFLLGLLVLLGPSVAARAQGQPAAPGAPYAGVVGDMTDCFLSNPAFCDNFSEGPYRGGLANRGGDLDPTKWSFSRLTETEDAGQARYFGYPPATAQFCQTRLPGVLPDRDSFMCNGTNGVDTTFRGTEEMHWMTTINDGGSYVANGARALQPFDFAGRTGTVAFAVDAVTRGSHSFWPDVVLADQPVADPHLAKPGVNSPPANGFEIDFNAGCGGVSGATGPDGGAISDFNGTTVGVVSVFTNYAEQDIAPQGQWAGTCAATGRDDPNLILLQISQTSLDVYMSDKAVQSMGSDGMMMMSFPTPKLMLHLDQSNGFRLNMARGYLSFQQAQYNAAKFNGDNTMTYHWHDMGFDGPVLPAQRAYAVPDSGTAVPLVVDGASVVGRNIGYGVNWTKVSTCCTNGSQTTLPQPFRLTGVDPTGARAAYVTFDWREDNSVDPGLQVRLNGQAWRPVTSPPNEGSFVATTGIAAIPLTDLRSGDNTLEFNAPSGVVIANIDLVVDANAAIPMPTSTSTSSSTMTMSSTTAGSSSTTAGSSSTASTSVATSTGTRHARH